MIATDFGMVIRASSFTAPREMHDQLLVACVLAEPDVGTARLVTADRDIRAAGLVEVLW